jgi:hypothetical protein
MKIEQEMWNRVTEFIRKRYPEDWGGAALSLDKCLSG